MNVALMWILGALAAGATLVVAGARSPVRSAAALLGAVAVISALLTWQGAGTVGALVLWILGGGAGLLVLLSALVLNISPEERGDRRFSIQATLALLVVGYVAAAVLGMLRDLEPHYPETGHSPSLSDGLLVTHGFTLALCGVALLTAVCAGLLVARRRG